MSFLRPIPSHDGKLEISRSQEKSIVERWTVRLGIILALAAVAYFWGYPAFRDFRKKRIVRIAQVFIQAEDYRSAYLLLDQHTKTNPDNREARRLLAKVLDEYAAGQGLAEWENLIKLEPENAANHVGFIASAMGAGWYQRLPEALATLQKLQPNGLEFHRLSAGFALAKGDAEALRRSVEAMAAIQPDNATTRFQ